MSETTELRRRRRAGIFGLWVGTDPESARESADRITTAAVDVDLQPVADLDTLAELVDDPALDCLVVECEGVPKERLGAVRAVAAERPLLAVVPRGSGPAAVEAGATDVLPPETPAAVAASRIATVAATRAGQRYRALLDSTSEGIAVHDPATDQLLDANARWFDLLDVDSRRERGLVGLIATASPYDRSTVRRLVESAAAGNAERITWGAGPDGAEQLQVTMDSHPVAGTDCVLASVQVRENETREP